jgi:hypothetical protein
MDRSAALRFDGLSDNPADYPRPQVMPLPDKNMDTTNDGYGWNLGTLFKGWELYNDSKATEVPSAPATVAGEKAGPNYLLYGGIALAVILLLRR